MEALMQTSLKILLLVVLGCAAASCTVHPHGEGMERAAATQAGRPYEHPIEDRTPPELAPDATPDELVRYALLTNADVEARYWEWRSALEQVPQEGTQKTNLSISLNSLITNGDTAARMTTLGVGNDAMNNLILPNKLETAAAVALDNARAAGFRFDSARYELKDKVLSAYLDYALTAELIRREEQNNKLLALTNQMIKLRIGTGTALQQDLLKAGNELETSKSDITALQAKTVGQLATINVLLNRDPTVPITVPKELPLFRPVPDDDEHPLQTAARTNPELRALAAEIAGKQDAVKLAKQEYLPEFGVNVSTDLAGVTQSLLGSVMVPALRYQAIDAGIRQAEDNLHGAEAMQHHFHHELAARIVTDLAVLRDAERQIDLLEKMIIPRAQQIVSASQVSYGVNQSSMLDLLDGQRSLIALRRLDAELKITREKQRIDLEAATGNDISSDSETW
jgi:outer membrane protein, heavy metal efflux system